MLQVKSLKKIVVYDLDKNLLPKTDYHKAAKFKIEKERLITRDKAWFLQAFSAEKENHADIDVAIEMIWRSLTLTPAVASRLCTMIWNLYKNRLGKFAVLIRLVLWRSEEIVLMILAHTLNMLLSAYCNLG